MDDEQDLGAGELSLVEQSGDRPTGELLAGGDDVGDFQAIVGDDRTDGLKGGAGLAREDDADHGDGRQEWAEGRRQASDSLDAAPATSTRAEGTAEEALRQTAAGDVPTKAGEQTLPVDAETAGGAIDDPRAIDSPPPVPPQPLVPPVPVAETQSADANQTAFAALNEKLDLLGAEIAGLGDLIGALEAGLRRDLLDVRRRLGALRGRSEPSLVPASTSSDPAPTRRSGAAWEHAGHPVENGGGQDPSPAVPRQVWVIIVLIVLVLVAGIVRAVSSR